MKIKNKIQMTLRHFEVSGVADVTMWGGGNGCVVMTKYKVASMDEALIKAGLNDGRFGAESINGGVCQIHAVYGNDELRAEARVYVDTMKVGEVSDFTSEYASLNI